MPQGDTSLVVPGRHGNEEKTAEERLENFKPETFARTCKSCRKPQIFERIYIVRESTRFTPEGIERSIGLEPQPYAYCQDKYCRSVIYVGPPAAEITKALKEFLEKSQSEQKPAIYVSRGPLPDLTKLPQRG